MLPVIAVLLAVSQAAKSKAHKSGIKEQDAISSLPKKLTTWLTSDLRGAASAGAD